MASFRSKLKSTISHAYSVFTGQEPDTFRTSENYGAGYSSRPDRARMFISNERSILASILTRIAIDAAQVELRHVRLDENNWYVEDIDSGLNQCLTIEANVDQAARFFRQDKVATLLDKGIIAVVPTKTTLNPNQTGGYDILSLRVGWIEQFFPRHVRVNVYNEDTGRRELVTLEKKHVAIVENPLYAVMNEPNSTYQRLLKKLAQLDRLDDKITSGKLDLIVQLPYQIRSDHKRELAAQRKVDIETQLVDSQYGIAYTDNSEKVIQLNRPVDNNMLETIKYLFEQLYGQLGITAEIMNGTADEKAMLNYNNRTVEPIVNSFTEEYNRKFLTKTARTQKQSIEFYRDPFKLVPMAQLAEMADKFTRNEIFSANEFRAFVGARPSKDPKANELRNSNMPRSDTELTPTDGTSVDEGLDVNGILDESFGEVEATIDGLLAQYGGDTDE